MDTPLVSIALPVALALIMFGLGLTLTVADFTRVVRTPKILAIALGCQLLVLPMVAFGLALLFDLPPILAVGMMLLAASPGGVQANLLSHLFRGDVALNISLTAVNSVIAAVTMPVVTNFALDYFEPEKGSGVVGLQFGKMIRVFAIVLIPVVVGMMVRRLRPRFADRMDQPVRIGSAAMILLLIAGAIIAERANLVSYIVDVGLITTLFCLLSLTTGFFVPRALGISEPRAIACSMEIGIHNGALAITIAISVLHSTAMAVPSAVYGLLALPLAALVAWLVTRDSRPASASPNQAPTANSPYPYSRPPLREPGQ
ncbi:bile acid:sodium symporter family protein [Nocardia sp. CDC159]|uniref:Bile acid:sodium symporter family protein n=1 Tax=Nocardia pulmonis TaxID=2951408 RepID=A0A9X2IYQ9_9NOCA|nr:MULTISPECIES: bile acid:sodium symporter family protein [Nocardia]MCM6775929.1 bile acid:sodium symporter family protein [Nocardia pulmonis]MCM6788095.1 bile acid:sodium symporter family protein [Nocardia sp. CDC159]